MANVLLQLYEGGWREQSADTIVDNERIEATLGSGSINTEEEAARVAAGQLALYATPTRSDTVTLDPIDVDDTPFLSHFPGQTVTTTDGEVPVESLVLSRDQHGYVTYGGELHSHIDTAEERTSNLNRKMSPGTFDGVSKVGQPLHPPTPIPTYRPREHGGGGGCCVAALNARGASSDTITPSGNETIVVSSPQTDTGGFLYPSETGLSTLPPGLYDVGGYVDVLFESEPTVEGSVFVAYSGGGTLGGDPEPDGGIVWGLAYVIPGTRLTVPFFGSVLRSVDWTPQLQVNNQTDVNIDEVRIVLSASGSCGCQHATTTPGS